MRLFWSTNTLFGFERYICEIGENNNLPEFTVKFDQIEYKGRSASDACKPILKAIYKNREEFPTLSKFNINYINGEDFFGLTEQSTIVKMTESVVHIFSKYLF